MEEQEKPFIPYWKEILGQIFSHAAVFEIYGENQKITLER